MATFQSVDLHQGRWTSTLRVVRNGLKHRLINNLNSSLGINAGSVCCQKYLFFFKISSGVTLTIYWISKISKHGLLVNSTIITPSSPNDSLITDITHFVEMSISYISIDTYKCEQTPREKPKCQHFILATGLNVLSKMLKLVVPECINKLLLFFFEADIKCRCFHTKHLAH